jgi:Fe-S cluster assembly iron-binding protein IscA
MRPADPLPDLLRELSLLTPPLRLHVGQMRGMVERVLPAIDEGEPVLTLTENASTIVKDIAAQQGGSDSTGLRISSEDPQQGLMVTAAQEPHPGDQTIESHGAVVYLDPPASQQLDDQVLDASVDEAGRVQFALAPQA